MPIWFLRKPNRPPARLIIACMKIIFLLTALVLQLFNSIQASDKWNLVWSDEFDYTGLPDPKRWTNEVGFIRNRESQYYTAGRQENARVENGKLIIEARKERFPNARYSPDSTRRGPEFAEYTSASLTTENLAEWKYGRIEVRAKIPQGRGVWPAIWMLGTNNREVGWPKCGEIDIMEFVGFEPDTIHAHIHTGKYNHVRGTGKGSRVKIDKPFESFHTYAVEWTSEQLDFFLDDRKCFTYKKEPGAAEDAWPFDQPFYLIINFAVGGAWGGRQGIDESIFPQRYEVDYVRVFSAGK